jgi:TolA-binding protein
MLRFIAICLLAGWSFTSALRAAEAPEIEAFNAAAKIFSDGFYEKAEKELSDFRAKYPQSQQLPRAVLLQAESEIKLKKYDPAVALLDKNFNLAGALSDQYLFQKAEALFGRAETGNGDYAEAASSYGRVTHDYPNSALSLPAAYLQALSHFRQKDLARTIELLNSGANAFQQLAIKKITDEPAVRGFLLLGEALLASNKADAARAAIAPLGNVQIAPELAWERDQLIARIEISRNQPQSALPVLTNALALAKISQKQTLAAQTLNLLADVFKKLDQPAQAIESYDQIIASEQIPPEQRRLALMKTVELLSTGAQITNAITRVEAYLAKNSQDPGADLLHLKAGELWLQQFRDAVAATNAPPKPGLRVATTNLLQQARTHFGTVIAQTNSAHIGKAFLDLGWALWEEGSAFDDKGRIAESAGAFQSAAEKLARSDDQALARFKLGDAHFAQRQFAPALTNYSAVLQNYADLPQIRNSLFEQSYEQLVRCHIELNDFQSAAQIVAKLRGEFPKSPTTEQTLFFYGQALARCGRTADARGLFADFLKTYPSSPLAPEVQLADGRTYALEGDWGTALARYNVWLTTFTNHTLRSEAEFQRAWFTEQTGDKTNAYTFFTNFVAQFPTNVLAPAAQNWIADYFYDQEKWSLAEQNYQRIFQNTNWLGNDLAFRSKLMAARTAFRRQGYAEARSYLTNLLADANCPREIEPEALFTLGDVDVEQPITGSTNSLQNFIEAANAFGRITQQYPTNKLALLAWGRKGDCHLQLATQYPQSFQEATNAYTQVLESKLPDIPVSALNQAEVGLAILLEKQAEAAPPSQRETILKQALDHLLNVVYARNLGARRPDPYYLKKAGLAAGRLAETLGQKPAAIELYKRLETELPGMRAVWEARIESLKKDLQASVEP